jgi:hypothetical protein
MKIGLATLAVAAVVGGGWLKSRHHDRRQDLAEALKRAGYEADDAGRVILTPNETGLSLGYDPNLHDPTTGFRACVAQIGSCLLTTKTEDECVRDSSRCVSATPWKDDPAGDDCCPESCIQEYFELRKTRSDMAALQRVVDGTCYPGMKDLASGKWKQ